MGIFLKVNSIALALIVLMGTVRSALKAERGNRDFGISVMALTMSVSNFIFVINAVMQF